MDLGSNSFPKGEKEAGSVEQRGTRERIFIQPLSEKLYNLLSQIIIWVAATGRGAVEFLSAVFGKIVDGYFAATAIDTPLENHVKR